MNLSDYLRNNPTSGYSNITTATGTAGSTTISVNYALDALLVFCNGIQLTDDNSEPIYYEASNGTSVIVHGTLADDNIYIMSFADFEVADAYTKIQSDTNYEPKNDDLYEKSNILGTVSQSAGVPTGAVIERGSNDDGEYVKFADGTLICTASVTFQNNGTGPADSKVISLPSTMLYLNGGQSFAVTCNANNATTSYCFPIGNADTATTIRVYLRKYDGSVVTSTAGQPGNYVAIGRWY